MTAASCVDPAEIVRQREAGWPDFHPEDYCHACGRPNPTWFADTAEWQTATGSEGDGGGILCPSCFCTLWEQVTGRTAIIWRLSIDPRSRDTAPASGADQPTLRDQLAEALPDSLGPIALRRPSPPLIPDGRPEPRGYGDQILDALLPVVERAQAEAAAEALEQAAERVPRWSPEVIAKWLRDRAASLRAVQGGDPGGGRS